MLNSKTRRCSNCRKKVPADSIYQTSLKAFCSNDCLISYVRSPKAVKAREKALQSDLKQRKAKLKTKGDWVKEAQTAFNAYIRARDSGKSCISCSAHLNPDGIGGGFDAGHYRSVGSSPHLRFRTDNCFGQCKKCNRYLSGNVANMRIGIAWRYGQQRLDIVEQDNESKHYTITDLQRIIQIFKKKRKKIEKKLYKK